MDVCTVGSIQTNVALITITFRINVIPKVRIQRKEISMSSSMPNDPQNGAVVPYYRNNNNPYSRYSRYGWVLLKTLFWPE